jgi:hypothetical protein
MKTHSDKGFQSFQMNVIMKNCTNDCGENNLKSNIN